MVCGRQPVQSQYNPFAGGWNGQSPRRRPAILTSMSNKCGVKGVKHRAKRGLPLRPYLGHATRCAGKRPLIYPRSPAEAFFNHLACIFLFAPDAHSTVRYKVWSRHLKTAVIAAKTFRGLPG